GNPVRHAAGVIRFPGGIPNVDEDGPRRLTGGVGRLVVKSHVVAARVIQLPQRLEADRLRARSQVVAQRRVLRRCKPAEYGQENSRPRESGNATVHFSFSLFALIGAVGASYRHLVRQSTSRAGARTQTPRATRGQTKSHRTAVSSHRE